MTQKLNLLQWLMRPISHSNFYVGDNECCVQKYQYENVKSLELLHPNGIFTTTPTIWSIGVCTFDERSLISQISYEKLNTKDCGNELAPCNYNGLKINWNVDLIDSLFSTIYFNMLEFSKNEWLYEGLLFKPNYKLFGVKTDLYFSAHSCLGKYGINHREGNNTNTPLDLFHPHLGFNSIQRMDFIFQMVQQL